MKKSLLTLTYVVAFAAITFSLTVCAQAQTVTTNLADFSYFKNGSRPVAAVVQGTDGNFYGVTEAGGINENGTFFRMTPSGTLTDLYNFCSQAHCADGTGSYSAPVLGSDGNFYGVTPDGGAVAAAGTGSGTVYKMTPGGKITTLYTFCRSKTCPDGQYPNGLIVGMDGNFYGATVQGGKFNGGEIFSISSTGALTVLHSFCTSARCVDGAYPQFPPVRGSDGNFYGTAGGGTAGVGVVYELTAAGVYTVLHSFCAESSCQDGWPPTQIVQDAKGNIFGTAQAGGTSDSGTVFEITAKHQFKVLHSFDVDGDNPGVGVTLANDGNFYGSSEGPQSSEGGGILFKITPAGVFTQLHVFTFCGTTGYTPLSPLTQGTNAVFYGTTLYGGNDSLGGCSGDGTIYSLSDGLSPFVKTVPAGGKVGNTVLILGNGLKGTTSVKFNGVKATFTVKSDTYISATVPAGASTGTVAVITPSGTLKSNPQFVVTK